MVMLISMANDALIAKKECSSISSFDFLYKNFLLYRHDVINFVNIR